MFFLIPVIEENLKRINQLDYAHQIMDIMSTQEKYPSRPFIRIHNYLLKLNSIISNEEASKLLNECIRHLKSNTKSIPHLEKEFSQSVVFHLHLHHLPSSIKWQAMMNESLDFRNKFHIAQARSHMRKSLLAQHSSNQSVNYVISSLCNSGNSHEDAVKNALSLILSPYDPITLHQRQGIFEALNASSVVNPQVYDLLTRSLLDHKLSFPIRLAQVWETLFPGLETKRFTCLTVESALFLKSGHFIVLSFNFNVFLTKPYCLCELLDDWLIKAARRVFLQELLNRGSVTHSGQIFKSMNQGNENILHSWAHIITYPTDNVSIQKKTIMLEYLVQLMIHDPKIMEIVFYLMVKDKPLKDNLRIFSRKILDKGNTFSGIDPIQFKEHLHIFFLDHDTL